MVVADFQFNFKTNPEGEEPAVDFTEETEGPTQAMVKDSKGKEPAGLVAKPT
jgi:hypothetical protein